MLYNEIKTFLFTGILFTTIGYIASFIDTLYASILYTYPFSMIPIAYYMHHSKSSKNEISDFVFTSSFGLALSFTFFITLSYAILYTNNIHISILLSSIVWFFFASIYYTIMK